MIPLSRLTYAVVVWWPKVEKVEARNLLKILQDYQEGYEVNYENHSNGSARSNSLFSISGSAYYLLGQTNCIQT